ncbi:MULTISPECIES: hypothetical protein [unclassified Streptomyces]|uniref:hypothetical protein n=1 Tax=unclassified Streptomyces TaxID=2593676 RepID=UPI001660950E|nr:MULTISPECIES: hypothetical protein [unclassified Streptomyces]MBD0708694.1 hypothetical protein [Streptomyces sp. CBMA291]MBD0714553.1 hypothetical protein [Streptomyces sp. CBMA370]
MRTVRTLATAALLGAALLGPAAPAALADSPSPSADPSAGPSEAGTTFRTATRFLPGQQATAQASSGDYLYWVFPADTGQRPTVNATVTLPEAALRHGPATWRIDVYDGLRRRQPCMYGVQSRTAAKDAATVDLACVLRPVRASADAWANDPLPGSYYVRLTVGAVPDEDLGQPFTARVGVSTLDKGGAYATDGALGAPLVPGATTADLAEAETEAGRTTPVEAAAPEDGWSSGWWSDRWLWTGAGAVLAALAGIGGYALTRGGGRPSRVPPGV